LSAAYALLVGGYRLSTAPLLGLNRVKSVLAVTALGLAGMFAAYTVLSDLGFERLPAVLLSQLSGVILISVLSGATVGFAVGGLRVRPRRPSDIFRVRQEVLRKVQPPRFWVLLFDSLPQMLFGTLFFIFIFGDRLVLWISSAARISGYSASYQIGLDSALLIIVPISVIQLPLIRRLGERLEDLALQTRGSEGSAFARGVGDLYSDLLTRIALPTGAICATAYVFSADLVGLAGGDGSSTRVFETGILGMFLFSIFLTNAALLGMFRRTMLTGVLLLVAAVMNIVLTLGFVTFVALGAAVLGFVLASLFLACASFIAIATMNRRADHAYYAAV
jgi:O-antigen/teichoic acid export membrane protein